MIELPEIIANEEQLNELLSRPYNETIEYFRDLEGDIIFLGIDGKIGPSLSFMAQRAVFESGKNRRLFGVSRFRGGGEKVFIDSGIEIIKGDLLDQDFLNKLPDVRNVIFLAGMKFGSVENQPLTWAVNTLLPAMVAEKYKNSRIIAYSTGCVYPFVPVETGGSSEKDQPLPVGEYAQSCLARERLFEYVSNKYGTRVALIRLNYAVELRYGVLVDIALKIWNNLPVDLSMGYFNVIWQGDANNYVLRSLGHCASPAFKLNITGREILSVREIALQFGCLMNKKPVLINQEENTALLNNASLAFRILGEPVVPVSKTINWIWSWLRSNGRLLYKPTHFETRDGKF
jgi:nucleoside-diphosphate-sugar epimerase